MRAHHRGGTVEGDRIARPGPQQDHAPVGHRMGGGDRRGGDLGAHPAEPARRSGQQLVPAGRIPGYPQQNIPPVPGGVDECGDREGRAVPAEPR